jgi:hypothetical protein
MPRFVAKATALRMSGIRSMKPVARCVLLQPHTERLIRATIMKVLSEEYITFNMRHLVNEVDLSAPVMT